MTRHSRTRLAVTTALSVAVLCAAHDARAQQTPRDPSTPSLFDPHFDGDTRRPQQFRRPGSTALPTSSAGTSGFDATNTKAKQKAKAAARKRARTDADNQTPIVSAAPDRTVATVFQKQESAAATRRRAVNTAAAPLDATGAIAPRPVRRRIVDNDPFGPVGFYRGPFLIRPSLDVSGGYNSNPGQRTNGKGSTFERLGAELDIRSDWSRHEIGANLRGSYIWYNDGQLDNLNKPDLALRGNARIDISKQTRGLLEGRFGLAADNPGDPNLPRDVAKPPIYVVGGGTVGLSHSFNRLDLTLTGSFDRTAYSDATLNDGTQIDLRDRNYDQYGMRLRASYETLPGIRPFVEYGMDWRRHDRTLDEAGYRRDSDGTAIRAGSSFELTGYLVGEASAGWFQREYKDAAFQTLHGMLFDASLTYYATPLTTLKLDAATTVSESILAGVSGALRHDYALQVEHSFRRWLIGNVRVGFGTDNYEGSDREDRRYLVAAGLAYKMSREVHWRAEYRREWLRSNYVGWDYTANIFLLGLRLQR